MRIKVYKKYELAKLYYPNLDNHTAVNRLMRQVNHCLPLLEALEREGYKNRNKTFSMRETLLVYEYLGEPENAYQDF